MTINAETKIAALLRHNPEALEAIVGLSPRFKKLRNPLLRKMMASRTTISMASKIGRCPVEDFFRKLQPLGFEIDRQASVGFGPAHTPAADPFPIFLKDSVIVDLDVRPVIEQGRDPLNLILGKLKSLRKGEVLKIINNFEPSPLIQLLRQRGYGSFVDHKEDDRVDTYFYSETGGIDPVVETIKDSGDWDEALERWKGNLKTIDVRKLEMPGPMHAILDALETLPEGQALFVYHKRIPVFLLPELAERHFDYRIKEVSDSEVHLLIYKS